MGIEKSTYKLEEKGRKEEELEKCKNLYDALVKECAENGDIENTIKLAELRLKLQLSRAKTGEMFTPDEIETLLKGVKEKKEKDKI